MRSSDRLAPVVQPAGGFVEQHDAAARRAAGSPAPGESRCPSDRSRGCMVVGDARCEPVEQRRGRGRESTAAGFAVGLRQLGGDACRGRAGRRASAAPARRASRAAAAGRVGGSRPPTSTLPAWRGPEPCSAHSSEDLPEPLRPISAVTSPASEVEVDVADGDDVAVAHHDVAGSQCACRPALTARRAGAAVPRGEPSRSAGGAAASVAHRQRQRLPASQPAELDHRRGDAGVVAKIVGGRAVLHRAVAGAGG